MKGITIRVFHQLLRLSTDDGIHYDRRSVGIIWYWLPALAYVWAIAFLSSLSSPEMHFQSLLHAVNPFGPVKVTIYSKVHDKLYHLVEYALLGILLYRAIQFSWGKKLGTSVALMTIFAVLLCGSVDELLQGFTPLRSMDGWDLMADVSGGFMGVSLWEWGITLPAVRLLEEQLPHKLPLLRSIMTSKF